MHALLLLPLLAAPGDEGPLSLPDGPAAKVWAGVGPETSPADIAARAGLWADWSTRSTWSTWASLVREEAAAEGPEPARRAILCLLARGHGRAGDAWAHYGTLGAEPGLVAAVTPRLLPGVPSEAAVEPGGRPAPLPDGVVLRPFLPPSSGEGPAGTVEWRSATAHGLRIGAAVVDLTVTVEATGVQVDLTHVSGGAATVSVLLPEPEGFEVKIEYLDWLRREDDQLRTPIPVELKPGEEPRQLYGRVLERRAALPTGGAQRLPAALVEGGLVFEVPDGDPDRAALEEIAAVVGELLGVEARLRAPGAPRGDTSGTVFRLPAGRERVERLRFLASAIERFLLD